MSKTVLVTAIGTATATAVIRALKQAGGFRIIGADINHQNEIATSLETDDFYQFPYSTGDDYIPFALDFCRAHHVDYYYAVIDKEVVNLAKNRSRFAEIGTKLCVPNYEFAEVCHFKNTFGNWIAEHLPEVAVKQYQSLAEAKDAAYPLFIKPVEGVASTGCRKIENFAELAAAVPETDFGSSILVQEFVSGRNITVDCVRNRLTGQKIQVQRKELLRNSNGCGIAVEIFRDPKLEQICDTLMEQLDLNGVVNMEFFDTGNGYKIIEINPRFSAGTVYSCMAGVNTVMNAMKIADGEPCEFGEIAVGAHFAERYEAYRMD
ncbi:MAG: ATP-grasp domain-containing protein [Oscillospiraceae bacterium]|nr:ATP-grasp domain-containing protein [Oscillospiraceae bacterium]